MIILPIICSGGIGDSLLILSRVPINLLGTIGFRFQLFYPSPKNEHPARKILMPFFGTIKYVDFVEGEPSSSQRIVFQKMMSLQQRLDVIWRPPIMNVVASRAHKFTTNCAKTILIQSHLDGHHGWKGATAKIWKIENWIALIVELNKLGYAISIMEWDEASRAAIAQACPYIHIMENTSLRDLCLGMSNFDIVVSIDSWTKYPAEWCKTRQVVVVPNLSQGYTPDFSAITADSIARWWFKGLLNNPRVKVLGLEKRGKKYEYTLPSLENLSVDTLLKEIQKLLPIKYR